MLKVKKLEEKGYTSENFHRIIPEASIFCCEPTPFWLEQSIYCWATYCASNDIRYFVASSL